MEQQLQLSPMGLILDMLPSMREKIQKESRFVSNLYFKDIAPLIESLFWGVSSPPNLGHFFLFMVLILVKLLAYFL